MTIEDANAGWLLAKNHKRLRAFVRRRVGDEVEADDISQEAHARVLARSKTTALADPVAYAFRVALNLVSDRGRSSGRVVVELEDRGLASAEASPFEALDMKQRADLYARTLKAMPRLRREVFVLRRSADLSYDQISAKLNISVEAAQKHYSRAAMDMRRVLIAEAAA